MQIREIMTTSVEVLAPDASLQDAAQAMRDLDVGMLPICDGTRLIGTLTDRDITIRATAEGGDPRTIQVSDVMTEEVVHCYEDQDLEEAATIMKELQIRRLPILSRTKALVGILSLGDLAVRPADEAMAAEALEGISEPSHVSH